MLERFELFDCRFASEFEVLCPFILYSGFLLVKIARSTIEVFVNNSGWVFRNGAVFLVPRVEEYNLCCFNLETVS
jgi:hypothetical protein